jgi:hypothetical protein
MWACLHVTSVGAQPRELAQDAVQGAAHCCVGRQIARVHKCCVASLLPRLQILSERLSSVEFGEWLHAFATVVHAAQTCQGRLLQIEDSRAGWLQTHAHGIRFERNTWDLSRETRSGKVRAWSEEFTPPATVRAAGKRRW